MIHKIGTRGRKYFLENMVFTFAATAWHQSNEQLLPCKYNYKRFSTCYKTIEKKRNRFVCFSLPFGDFKQTLYLQNTKCYTCSYNKILKFKVSLDWPQAWISFHLMNDISCEKQQQPNTWYIGRFCLKMKKICTTGAFALKMKKPGQFIAQF